MKIKQPFFCHRADLPGPSGFFIPHSISLDEENNRLYVADRENGRVIVFGSKSGKPLAVYKGFGGRVFALHYCPSQGMKSHKANAKLEYVMK